MRVLVTGGGHGIGKAAVLALQERGHTPLVLDREQAYLDELPDTITTFHADVYDTDAVRDVVADEAFSVLVNCAGYQRLGAVEDMAYEEMEEHFRSNVFGLVKMTREALPMLREADGRIVNVSSISGLTVFPHHGSYCASKHAVEAFSDALRMELMDTGVDVVVVEPGVVETGFNRQGRDHLKTLLQDTRHTDAYEALLAKALDGISPETAGNRLADIVETDRPRTRYRITREARWVPRLERLLPTRIADRLRLWWAHR